MPKLFLKVIEICPIQILTEKCIFFVLYIIGETSTFTYWAPGQPHSSHRRFLLDSVSDEDCVLLKYSDSGHWHDYPCEKLDPFGLVRERFPYICEYCKHWYTIKTIFFKDKVFLLINVDILTYMI